MTDASLQASFERAAQLIDQADALIIGAGAGIGVDSELPDFRSGNGFWNAYPALAKAQLDFTDIANPRTFEKDPSLAWGFYGHRLELYRKTIPNPGFAILRKWSEQVPLGHWIFTSNVDGQFQKAGFSEEHINECHGSIHHLQCMRDCVAGVWSAEHFIPKVDSAECRLTNEPPSCIACSGLARPNIMMFGDWHWVNERNQAQRRREAKWFDQVTNSLGNVVIVEIGAGTSIPSVRNFSHRISREFGARIIRINPREPQVPSSKDVGIASGATRALQGIEDARAGLE
jgi:NAD-dependent SIR2 family protein deacetylase